MASDGFKRILAKFLYVTAHTGADKLVTVLNWHWWKNFGKTVEVICRSYVTYQQRNLGKTIKLGHSQEPKPQGALEHLQMDCTQLLLSMSFEYI